MDREASKGMRPGDCAKLATPGVGLTLVWGGAWHFRCTCDDIANNYARDQMALGMYYLACQKSCKQLCEGPTK